MLRRSYKGITMSNRTHLPPHHGGFHNHNFTDKLLSRHLPPQPNFPSQPTASTTLPSSPIATADFIATLLTSTHFDLWQLIHCAVAANSPTPEFPSPPSSTGPSQNISPTYVALKQLVKSLVSWLQTVDSEFAAWQNASPHCNASPSAPDLTNANATTVNPPVVQPTHANQSFFQPPQAPALTPQQLPLPQLRGHNNSYICPSSPNIIQPHTDPHSSALSLPSLPHPPLPSAQNTTKDRLTSPKQPNHTKFHHIPTNPPSPWQSQVTTRTPGQPNLEQSIKRTNISTSTGLPRKHQSPSTTQPTALTPPSLPNLIPTSPRHPPIKQPNCPTLPTHVVTHQPPTEPQSSWSSQTNTQSTHQQYPPLLGDHISTNTSTSTPFPHHPPNTSNTSTSSALPPPTLHNSPTNSPQYTTSNSSNSPSQPNQALVHHITTNQWSSKSQQAPPPTPRQLSQQLLSGHISNINNTPSPLSLQPTPKHNSSTLPTTTLTKLPPSISQHKPNEGPDWPTQPNTPVVHHTPTNQSSSRPPHATTQTPLQPNPTLQGSHTKIITCTPQPLPQQTPNKPPWSVLPSSSLSTVSLNQPHNTPNDRSTLPTHPTMP